MYFFYFLPLGLEGPPRRFPVMTVSLLAVMSVLFVWAHYLPLALPVRPWDLVFFAGGGQPWSVLTAVFLHAQWLHFLGNAVYLAIFGAAVEDRLGPGRLLLHFTALGCAGNLAHGWADLNGWLGGPGIGVMGASGAIAGLLAVALVRFPWGRLAIGWWLFAPLQGVNRAGRALLPLPVAVLVWVLLQVVRGLASAAAGSSVSHAAHLGGFAAGIALALLAGLRLEGKVEGRLVRGRRYLQQGQALAAEGCFLEALRQAPADREARLLLARSRRMAGRPGEALADYRQVLQQDLKRGQPQAALEVWREARLGGPLPGLTATQLARLAFLLEKQARWAEAVEAHLDVHALEPQTERGQLAIVRACVLLKGRLGRHEEARERLAAAGERLGPGPWRDFLEGELRPGREPRAGGAGSARSWRPEAAT